MKNLGVTPTVRRTICPTVVESTNAASAHTTSTHGSCASASSSSARRWTTPLRTSSARSCSSSSPKSRQGHQPLHQLARRRDHGALRHLRHHEVHPRDVSTFCFGQAASAAAVLLASGPWQAFALPTPASCCTSLRRRRGQASDIELQAKEILRMRDMLTGMLAEDTGQPVEKVSKDTTATSS